MLFYRKINSDDHPKSIFDLFLGNKLDFNKTLTRKLISVIEKLE